MGRSSDLSHRLMIWLQLKLQQQKQQQDKQQWWAQQQNNNNNGRNNFDNRS